MLTLMVARINFDHWIPAVFDEYLARPLGIGHYHFNLTPTGQGYMGGGLRLRPRDQLKLGQLMLDGGTWQGERLLSEAWVADSIAAHAGLHEPDDYGYGWWRSTLTNPATGATHLAINAGGNGGQFIIFIADLDLVIQISAGNYMDFRTWYPFLRELVPEYIIAAAR